MLMVLSQCRNLPLAAGGGRLWCLLLGSFCLYNTNNNRKQNEINKLQADGEVYKDYYREEKYRHISTYCNWLIK